MKVYFIGAGPGDAELITVRGARILSHAPTVIYAGSLVNPKLLELCKPDAKLHDSSKLTLEEVCTIYIRAKEESRDTVRLHSGDPSLYGAIGEQMDWLDEHGIPYEVIPGVSSFSAAAAAMRRELTSPELTQTVILTRLSGRTPVPEAEDLARLAQARATMVIFLSVHKIERVVEKLLGSYPPKTPVAVVSRASWPDEQVIRGRLTDIVSKVHQAGLERSALIIVGSALQDKYKPSRLYAHNFSHGFR